MSHENGIPSRVVEGEPLLDLIGEAGNILSWLAIDVDGDTAIVD